MASKDSEVNVNQEVWDKVVKMEEERSKDPNYESCCSETNPCSCATYSPNMPSPEDAKKFVKDCEKLAKEYDAKVILNGKRYIIGYDAFMEDVYLVSTVVKGVGKAGSVGERVAQYAGRPSKTINDESGRWPVFDEVGGMDRLTAHQVMLWRKAFESWKPVAFAEKYGKTGKLPILYGTMGMELPEPKTRLQKIIIRMKNFIKKYKR